MIAANSAGVVVVISAPSFVIAETVSGSFMVLMRAS
jgi:hypothetical protein